MNFTELTQKFFHPVCVVDTLHRKLSAQPVK